MKELVLSFVLALFTTAAYAADGKNETGTDSCGLGWQVTQKKSLMATSTRGTTNGIVPPHFGMTTGTIGCDQHSFAKKDAEAVDYVVANYDILINEIAEGDGEFLNTFAAVMGCEANSSFNTVTQEGFSKLSSSSNAVDFVNKVKSEIKSDQLLAAQCNLS